MPKTPKFVTHRDTQMTYNRLIEMEVGDIWSYEDLSDYLGGIDVQKPPGYTRVKSARDMALRDGYGEFQVVAGVGIKRATDAEMVKARASDANMVHNRSKRSMRCLTSVKDYNGLSNELKIQHNALVSVFGAIFLQTKKAEIKKVEKKVADTGRELSIGDTLRLFFKPKD